MGVGLYLAGFDIIPIAPRQDTSTELSVSGAGDARALRSLLPVSESVLPVPPRGGVKPSKSAPYVGVRLSLAGFDIGSIGPHHETSTELSTSSGGDARALRSLLPVRESVLPVQAPGGVKPSKSAPYMGSGLSLAGFDIRPINTRNKTSTELS